MSVVNLLAVVVVLFATGTITGALVVSALRRPTVAHLRRFAPEIRVRWLTGLLSLPCAMGLVTVAVAFGPCLHNLALGVADGCRDHGGPEFFFCLRSAMRNVPVAWVGSLLLLGFASWRVVLTGLALLRARRAFALLRHVGRWDDSRAVWLVPGTLAMVAGFPFPRIYLGETILERFSPQTFDAILAHERAHAARRDLTTKLAAQAFAMCLARTTGGELLAELDLAIEQACDAAAAVETRDPLLVARSLVDVASIEESPNGFALAFAPYEHLEARVRALCEPAWLSSRSAFAAVSALATAFLFGCLVFDPKLHDAAEAFFGRLLGG